jgi:ketol-acid reductoisomerase
MNASDVLNNAARHLEDRAVTYDSPQGERSMGSTVAMFNALVNQDLTEEQGWLFMAILKMVRSQQGGFKADNYEDGAAYFALACECRSRGEEEQ